MHVIVSLLVVVVVVSDKGGEHHPGEIVDDVHYKEGKIEHPIEWLVDQFATSSHLLHSRKWGRDPEVYFY